jgi:hypothetical protein
LLDRSERGRVDAPQFDWPAGGGKVHLGRSEGGITQQPVSRFGGGSAA